MHNKLVLYIPNKKVSNINFIMSINNVINNYEIKKEEQIRKDYITKSLIIIANQLKYHKYKWISYDEFLTNEKNIINDINNNITINPLNELINAVNNLDLDNSDNHLNEENNDNKENVNENDHEDGRNRDFFS